MPDGKAERDLLEVLADRVAETYGAGTTVMDLKKLSGGASRETWSFDAQMPDGTKRPLILKRDPILYHENGTLVTDARFQVGNSRMTEGRLIELAGDAGVPVPGVAFYLTADARTTEGFVMERLAGETLGLRIARDEAFAEARQNLAFQCGHAAATTHAITLASLPRLDSRNVGEELAYNYDMMMSSGHPYPGFEYGFRWLTERVELAGDQHTLVHGDFRNGNFLVGPEGLRGVLDWELAHLGNPVSDLGWICVRSWRYGYLRKPVGGFGEIEDLKAGYEAGGGAPIRDETLHFWEVFGTLHWGMLCINMTFNHLSGRHPSLEYAAIGRRTAETEYDLLQILN